MPEIFDRIGQVILLASATNAHHVQQANLWVPLMYVLDHYLLKGTMS